MEAAEKVMIACLLIHEGGEDEAVKGFIFALEEGLSLGEQDSIDLHRALMDRMRTSPPAGPAGEIIRLMNAKREFDDTKRKFGMMVSGLEKVLQILQAPAKSDLAAKILISKILKITSDTSRQIVC